AVLIIGGRLADRLVIDRRNAHGQPLEWACGRRLARRRGHGVVHAPERHRVRPRVVLWSSTSSRSHGVMLAGPGPERKAGPVGTHLKGKDWGCDNRKPSVPLGGITKARTFNLKRRPSSICD
ncbi:hypothetical protein THAOC_21176, partial [Thalassiosira oceanica]